MISKMEKASSRGKASEKEKLLKYCAKPACIHVDAAVAENISVPVFP
jgi:hypothetical protein